MPVDYYPGFRNVGSIGSDNLIAGDFPMARLVVTLKAGVIYLRGTILQALADADAGKYGPVTVDANAVYVLLEDRDATAGDLTSIAATTGEFNQHAVILGAGATLAGVRAALEPKNIYLRDAVRA